MRTRLPASAAHSSSARGLRGRLRFSRFSIAWVSMRLVPIAAMHGDDAAREVVVAAVLEARVAQHA